MEKKDSLRPYYDAMRQIFEGTPVENLEEIRENCNKNFSEIEGEALRKDRKYKPELVVAVFAATAENKILNGLDPSEAYGGFEGERLDELRKRSREVLENCIESYYKTV